MKDQPLQQYFKGDVINLWGDNLLLQDIMIDGYREGRAMLLRGNRIQVVRPRVKNPDMLGAAGLRFTGGEGFRCYDGDVEAGDDAAYQFSTQENSGPIIDGAYIGCRGKSSTGRFLLVGTKFDEIRNVRFEGISGEGGAGANCVKVQNSLRDAAGDLIAPISDVLFADIDVSSPASGAAMESVLVENELAAGSVGTVTNIRFENFVIRNPRGVAFMVKGGANGVDGLSWRGGGVPQTKPGFAAMSLDGLANGVFEAIELGAGTNQSFILVGAITPCKNVAFSDAVVKGVNASSVGVEFNQAVNCGWSRGGMSGESGAKPARITGLAQACYVEGANLVDIGTEPKIDVPASGGHRIANNYGSTQRTGVGLGAKTSATMSGASLTVTSSSVEVSAGGTGPANLDTINGGQEGDVLVLRKASASPTVTLRDGVVPGNLSLAGNFPLNTPDDTITLTKISSSSWLEVSRSNNL